MSIYIIISDYLYIKLQFTLHMEICNNTIGTDIIHVSPQYYATYKFKSYEIFMWTYNKGFICHYIHITFDGKDTIFFDELSNISDIKKLINIFDNNAVDICTSIYIHTNYLNKRRLLDEYIYTKN